MSRTSHDRSKSGHELDYRSRLPHSYAALTPLISESSPSHSRSRSSDTRYRPPRRIPSSTSRILPPPLASARKSPPALSSSPARPALFATPRLPPPLPSRGLPRPTATLLPEAETVRTPERQSPRLPVYALPRHSPLPYWRVRQTSPTHPTPARAHVPVYKVPQHRGSISQISLPPRTPSPPPFRVGPKTYDPLRPESLYKASKGAQRDLKWRQKQRQTEPVKPQPRPQQPVFRVQPAIRDTSAARYSAQVVYAMASRTVPSQSQSARHAQLEAINMAKISEEKKALEMKVQNQVYSHARPTKCHWTGCEAQCTSWALLEKHLACCHLHRDADAVVDDNGLFVCQWAKNGKDKCGRTFATKQDCLAHCIAKDGHMDEYDSRCPYNCATNKRTFADLMAHITKRHRATTSPTVPLLLPVKPTLADDLPPLKEKRLSPSIIERPVLDRDDRPAIPGLELYSRLVKPSPVSPQTRDMILAKECKETPPDGLHSLPNQRAGGAAITALTNNARNRRSAIEELRARDPSSDLIPPPAVFVAHELHQLVADMLAAESAGSSTENLDYLLDLLNTDPPGDAIVRADNVAPSMHARVDGRSSTTGTSTPNSNLSHKSGSSSRHQSASQTTKPLEPVYAKVDVKKLHKQVKLAVWQASMAEKQSRVGSRPRRARNGDSSTPAERHLSNTAQHDATASSSSSRRRSSASCSDSSASSRGLQLRLDAKLNDLIAESSDQRSPTRTSGRTRRLRPSDIDAAPLTAISMSVNSSSMSLGTSASSVFIPTPTSCRSRSTSQEPQLRGGQGFATSDERGGSASPTVEPWRATVTDSLEGDGGLKRKLTSSEQQAGTKRRR